MKCLRTPFSSVSIKSLRAYQSLEGKDLLPRYRAHEVRGITSTLLFKRNFAVDQMLKVGVWRSPTTFTSFVSRVHYS